MTTLRVPFAQVVRAFLCLATGALLSGPGCSIRPKAAATGAAQDSPVRVNEKYLRRMIVRSEKPEYPASSIKTNAVGPAVALVRIDRLTGVPSAITVLEAPDEATGLAFKASVQRWAFDVNKLMKINRSLEGTLTVYFVRRGTFGYVVHPYEYLAR